MRPPDKLEQRARELAIAAGLNPDDRVGEGRGLRASHPAILRHTL